MLRPHAGPLAPPISRHDRRVQQKPPPSPHPSQARTASLPSARDVGHIGITVPDLDEAVRFFTDVLGCRELYREGPFEDAGTWMADRLGVDRGDVLHLAMLRCGPSTNVELLEYRGAGADGRPLNNARAGATHLAFFVDDLEAALAYLRRQPGVVVQGVPSYITRGPSAGLSFIYFRAPWGLQLELVSYPPGMPYEAETPLRLRPPAPAWVPADASDRAAPPPKAAP